MEKKSQEWYTKFQQTLSEKYLYILKSELKNYDVLKCYCDEIIHDNNGNILELSLDVQVDYTGAIDGDAHSIGWMLDKINDDIRDVLYKFAVHKETYKFTKGYDDFFLTDGTFLEVNYKLDEKHEAHVFYKYEYGVE